MEFLDLSATNIFDKHVSEMAHLRTTVMLNPMWITHLFKLLGRAWIAMVNSTSTNTLGFIIWTVVITAVCWMAQVVATWRQFVKSGTLHPFRTSLANNILTGLYTAAGILTLVILVWAVFTGKIIYDDHTSLVAENKKLHDKVGELTNHPPQCWLTNLGMKPPPTLPNPNYKSSNTVVFFCDHEYEPPFSIIWEFDRKIAGVSVPFFPDARPMKASIHIEEKSAWSFVEMPALNKYQPTALVVYGDDPKLPPMATQVTVRLLTNEKQPVDMIIKASNSR